MTDINDLRLRVRKAHALAGKKVSRLKTHNNADIAGTRLDPRRDPALIKRYTRKQLESYLGSLDTFRSRKVQYATGATGNRINMGLWQKYKAAERAYNRKANERLRAVSGIKLLGSDATIGERDEAFKPVLQAKGASTRPYARTVRDVTGIVDDDAIKKLTAQLQKKLSADYSQQTIVRQRMELADMLTSLGESDLIDLAGGLTDRQFDALWNYTDFATNVSERYEVVKSKNVTHDAATSEDFRDDIVEILAWAETIK